MQKLIALFLMLASFASTGFVTFAKQKGDWGAIKNSVNQEIAVKTANGKTSFGVLRSVDDNGIKIQFAEKKGLSSQETTIGRDEIKKIWQASLRYGERQIGKGALIGAGIGAGFGFIAGATAKEPDPLNYAGVLLYGIAGAGVGAVAGIFSKKGHQKKYLLYAV